MSDTTSRPAAGPGLVVVSAAELEVIVARAVRAALGEAAPAGARLPLAQAARVAGVSVRVLRGAVARGELPAARPGRSYVVAQADLDAWLGARRACPRPRPERSDPASEALAQARRRGRLRAL